MDLTYNRCFSASLSIFAVRRARTERKKFEVTFCLSNQEYLEQNFFRHKDRQAQFKEGFDLFDGPQATNKLSE